MKEPPSNYQGTLGELYQRWAKDVLLEPSVVETFHRQFCAFVESEDPLFLVRKVTGLKRGQTLRTAKGAKLRATDNAPAWWIHFQLFSRQFRQSAPFVTFIETVPGHMFDVRVPESINTAKWHAAHIFGVNNGDVGFHNWDHRELAQRMARNIHPCNCFYIPKCEWRRHGDQPTVIAFFYDKFRSLYGAIWEDFLRLVGGTPLTVPAGASEYRYSFPTDSTDQCGTAKAVQNQSLELQECVAMYSHPRLCFKAAAIEPLGADDKFCIKTNDGIFAMTKREFYKDFPGVTQSKSYRHGRMMYHYPTPPRRALQFKVNSCGAV